MVLVTLDATVEPPNLDTPVWQSKCDKIIKFKLRGTKVQSCIWKAAKGQTCKLKGAKVQRYIWQGAKGQTCKFKELVYQLILYFGLCTL